MKLVAADPVISAAGCAFVLADDAGGARTVVLDRNAGPFALPRLDSVAKGRASRQIFQVVRYTVYPRATLTAPLTIACLAPAVGGYAAELERRIRSTTDWSALMAKLDDAPVKVLSHSTGRVPTQSTGKLAGEALKAATFPNARQVAPPRLVNFSDWTSDTSTRAHSLPPIEVTATRNSWTIDQWALLQDAKHWRSYSHEVSWEIWYYDGPDCGAASDFWFLEDLEIAEMEEYLPLYESLTTPLENYQCEHVAGKPICIDLWIMNHRSFVFSGNDRHLDPYAGINESKAHIYFDPVSKEWEVKIATTYLLFTTEEGEHVKVRPEYDSTGLFRPDEDIKVTILGNGDIQIQYKFMNNYCHSRTGCPAIDGTVTLRPDASQPGGFNVGWERDGFPSMAVFKDNGDGTWTTMAFDPERSRNPWLNWLNLIFGRQSTHQLPQGCNLQ